MFNTLSSKTSGVFERRKWDGREYLVVPGVWLVEGVHNESLVTHAEFAKFPESWNGRPVVINHPVDAAGNFISANDPAVLERQGVGFHWLTKADGSRLTGEAWLDIARLQRIAPEVLESVLKGNPVEVSTGFFREQEVTGGEWNGEAYTGIDRGIRPDHLAILPSDTGACSLKDGCGLGVHQSKCGCTQGGNDMGKKEIIGRLVACTRNKLTDADAEWLDGLEVNQLQAMEFSADPTPEVKADPETVDTEKAEKPDISAMVKAEVDRQRAEDKRATLIEDLSVNEAVGLTKEALGDMGINALQALASRYSVNQSGRGGAANPKTEDNTTIGPMPKPDWAKLAGRK